MDPNAFIAEVYRRMAARHTREAAPPAWPETESSKIVLQTLHQYAPYLPGEKTARILDVGFGSGWFLAGCVNLGYRDLLGRGFCHRTQDPRSRLGFGPDCAL